MYLAKIALFTLKLKIVLFIKGNECKYSLGVSEFHPLPVGRHPQRLSSAVLLTNG